METNQKIVSVIIPVYNGEDYIQKCLRMLLNQIGTFEIIIINDGSTDQTDSLIQPFLEDDRIIYLKQNNMGVSAARNAGISIATGNYITFVDIDDDVNPDFINQLIQINKTNAYDIIWFSSGKFTGDNDDKSYEENRADIIVKSILGSNDMRYREYQYMWSVWSKIYKTSFIKNNNIKFDPQIRLGEDIFFNLECYSYSPVSYIVDQNYYHYIQSPSSVSHSGNINDMFWFNTCYKKYEYLQELNPTFWKREDIQFWMNRFILNYGILIVGRVARSTRNMKFKKRIKYIKQITKHTRSSMKKMGIAYILKSILSKDMTIIKLLFMDIFTPLYLLKFNRPNNNI